MVNREFATFFMVLPPLQGDPCKRSAHSATVVVHVPLPRVRCAIIHEGRVEAVGRGVVEQEGTSCICTYSRPSNHSKVTSWTVCWRAMVPRSTQCPMRRGKSESGCNAWPNKPAGAHSRARANIMTLRIATSSRMLGSRLPPTDLAQAAGAKRAGVPHASLLLRVIKSTALSGGYSKAVRISVIVRDKKLSLTIVALSDL